MARAEPESPASAPGGERRGVTRVGLPVGPWAEEAVMSEETVPQQGGTGQPKGLLQQMEKLMAALNADLSDLQSEAGFSPRESKADQARSE
ncbi:predicted protein [Streptomyces viridochromogenes DSM 40736]|uniref:Predicted protein n=2 Tax=Streptomyces viridochromogenes TaxID=1938 RepID=D9X0B9_STRVT|nr:predicted protein [Streptomyces viridochromogenes DSM 40736]